MPRSTLILDSSQISTFFECEEKWNLKYSQSLTQIETPDAPESKTAAGTLGHKLLEIYYTNLGSGIPQNEAARLALDFNPDEADKIDSGFPLTDELKEKVQKRFQDYLMFWGGRDYQISTRPKHIITTSEKGFLVDAYRPEPLIEQGFSYALLNTKEYLFVLEGRIDFIGETHNELLWMDHKFQMRRRQLYKKSIQFRNYAMATGLSIGVINYIRLADKVDKETFVREPIAFTRNEIHEWKQELTERYIDMVQRINKGEFTLNRDSCSGKFGYQCEFTKICEEYSPNTRAAITKSNFKKRKEWRPW